MASVCVESVVPDGIAPSPLITGLYQQPSFRMVKKPDAVFSFVVADKLPVPQMSSIALHNGAGLTHHHPIISTGPSEYFA